MIVTGTFQITVITNSAPITRVELLRRRRDSIIRNTQHMFSFIKFLLLTV